MRMFLPFILLTISNIFMTFAWYGHLKHRHANILLTILASWGIAFFEYCFQVPANRLGSYMYSTAQSQDRPGNRHADRLLLFLRAVPG